MTEKIAKFYTVNEKITLFSLTAAAVCYAVDSIHLKKDPMSTFTQILYQIVFSTKERERTLTSDKRAHLFEYVWGILNKKNCHLYQINGVEDHIHIATHIHPTVALSSLVKDIKIASSGYIKEQAIFKHFSGWQDGYAAFTYSFRDKNNLIEYIKNQEVHHKKMSFKDELIALLNEHGIPFEEKYLL